jgi:hypothetical protein
MKINPRTEIRDFEDKPWVQGDGETITLKTLIFMALNNPIQNEPWNAEARMKIFDICVKVTGTDSAELEDGEPTFILERADKLGNQFSPLAYARLKEVLKPAKLELDPINANGAKASVS